MKEIITRDMMIESKANRPLEGENATGAPWHYVMARNMLGEVEWCELPEKEQRIKWATIENTVKRVALSIEIGGYLKLERGPHTGKWNVYLVHHDYSDELVCNFRRRKRAESWIANMYMFALDSIGNPR